jgi:hypothetical protein
MSEGQKQAFPAPLVLPCWTADDDGATLLYADDGTLRIVVSEGRRLATVDLSSDSQQKLREWLV